MGTYENTFTLNSKLYTVNSKLSLCLPGLKGVAHVIINGEVAGYVWCTPWDVDITPYVKKGKNRVKIEVRNSLVNRLVGDARLPEQERHTWLFTPLYTAKSRLVPSGLMGTVDIVVRTIQEQ